MSATMNRRMAFRALGVGTATVALGCAVAPAAQAQQMAHPQKAMTADQQLKLILRRLEQVPARLKYAKPGSSNRVNSGIESALGNLTTVQGTDAGRQIASAKAAVRKSDGRAHAALSPVGVIACVVSIAKFVIQLGIAIYKLIKALVNAFKQWKTFKNIVKAVISGEARKKLVLKLKPYSRPFWALKTSSKSVHSLHTVRLCACLES